MSMEAARSTMSDAFTTAWAAQYPSVPASYENRKFAQPQQEPWIDFNLVQVTRQRKNLGTTKRFVRTTAMVVLEIYVPEDSGTKSLYEMADYIGTALEDQNYAITGSQNITALTSTQRHDGKMDGFYRQTVMIPFWFDEAIAGRHALTLRLH